MWLDVLEPFPWLKLDQDLNFRASEPPGAPLLPWSHFRARQLWVLAMVAT